MPITRDRPVAMPAGSAHRGSSRAAISASASSAKPSPRAAARDIARLLREAVGEIRDVRDADRMRKEGEHRLVVRRVAGEHEPFALRIEIDGEDLAHQPARHAELVVVAEPAIDVDRAQFRGGAGLAEQPEDAIDRRVGQPRHVLAIVDREIALAVGLVGRERGARNGGKDALAEPGEPRALLDPHRRFVEEAANQVPPVALVAEIEGAVLADHRIDRPEAGDHVAPAGGPAGDRHHQEPRALQAPRARRRPRR